ncbi:MAG: branched-chain amino acid ABC transporter permease [Spirochaetales bacterium]|nr:branched-chain amino acid ABC transporter permease [Spirochaetales bacterium]
MADLLVSGIIYGSIITLAAIGLTLMSDILKFFNFAYGDFFSLGAYGTLLMLGLLPQWAPFAGLSFGWGLILSLLIGILITVAVMLLFEWLFFRRLRQLGVSSLFVSIASLGVAFAIRAVINIAWGPKVRYYSNVIQISRELPLGIRITSDEIVILVSALVLVVLVYLFLKRTRMGKSMRAFSDNVVLAAASGVSTRKVILWTWIISGVLVAVAGTFYGIEVQLSPGMGWSFLIPMFVAVIMGGIGSFWGALVGGMTIGISEELITGLVQNLVNTLEIQADISVYKPAVAFIFVVLILLLKPYGIFGKRER